MITDDLQFKIKTHGLNFKFVFKREIIFKLRFNNIYIIKCSWSKYLFITLPLRRIKNEDHLVKVFIFYFRIIPC